MNNLSLMMKSCDDHGKEIVFMNDQKTHILTITHE